MIDHPEDYEAECTACGLPVDTACPTCGPDSPSLPCGDMAGAPVGAGEALDAALDDFGQATDGFCRTVDRLRQWVGTEPAATVGPIVGEAPHWPGVVADCVLDTPEPDRWVDCGESRPLPMFHMFTLMRYGERCAEAALSTFTHDVKTAGGWSDCGPV